MAIGMAGMGGLGMAGLGLPGIEQRPSAGVGTAPSSIVSSPAAPPAYETGLGSRKTRDLGKGKYEILSDSDQVLGVGYKSLDDTLRDLSADYRKNKQGVLREQAWDKYQTRLGPQYDQGMVIPSQPTRESAIIDDILRGMEDRFSGQDYFGPRPTYAKDEFDRIFADKIASVSGPVQADLPTYGSNLAKWEAIGQFLRGSQNDLGGYAPIDPLTGYQMYEPTFTGKPHNRQADLIRGEEALYGSTPVFQGGKLVGYKTDLTPGAGENPLFEQESLHNKREAYQSYLGRKYVDPDQWKNLLRAYDDGAFVPVENVDKLPGWENVDDWQYQKAPRVSGLGKALGKLAPILKFTPLAPFGFFIDAARGMESGKIGGALASAALGGLAHLGGFGGVSNASPAGMEGALGSGISGPASPGLSTPTFGLDGSLGSGLSMGAVSPGISGTLPMYGAGPLSTILPSVKGAYSIGKTAKALSQNRQKSSKNQKSRQPT